MSVSKSTGTIAVSAALCLSGYVQADTAESTCEFWQEDEIQAERSGDCLFSQRQGYIGITLADESRIDLVPTDTMEYRDQQDRPVVRKVEPNGKNTFIWQGSKLVLWFGRADGVGQ